MLAFRDEHVVAGTGKRSTSPNLKADPNARYSVVHVGDPLRDPDDGKVVGYEGIYTGDRVGLAARRVRPRPC